MSMGQHPVRAFQVYFNKYSSSTLTALWFPINLIIELTKERDSQHLFQNYLQEKSLRHVQCEASLFF